MITQDPIMSLVVFVIAPPLGDRDAQAHPPRAHGRSRTNGPAARGILETLQETLQGMRIVKAFTLEGAVRARFHSHVRRCRARIQQDGAR